MNDKIIEEVKFIGAMIKSKSVKKKKRGYARLSEMLDKEMEGTVDPQLFTEENFNKVMEFMNSEKYNDIIKNLYKI